MKGGNEKKICKYCQSEIPKKAKVCPVCRKKQGGIGKIILIAAVILILFAAIGGGSSETEVEETTKAGNVSVGDTFDVDGLKVTVNSADLNYSDYDDEFGLHNTEEGYKYVKVSFTYENKNDSDKYVSIYDYDCYADGTLCEQYFLFGGDFINANLSSGRNVSFDTYYVVPADATVIELEYTENIFTDDKIYIELN